jgi:hypothetical protein
MGFVLPFASTVQRPLRGPSWREEKWPNAESSIPGKKSLVILVEEYAQYSVGRSSLGFLFTAQQAKITVLFLPSLRSWTNGSTAVQFDKPCTPTSG